MKKTIKNSIVLAACLLMAFMVKATIIGGSDANAANEQNSVLGCDDTKTNLRKIDCKKTTPVYACGTNGNLEVCTETRSCPAN